MWWPIQYIEKVINITKKVTNIKSSHLLKWSSHLIYNNHFVANFVKINLPILSWFFIKALPIFLFIMKMKLSWWNHCNYHRHDLMIRDKTTPQTLLISKHHLILPFWVVLLYFWSFLLVWNRIRLKRVKYIENPPYPSS